MRAEKRFIAIAIVAAALVSAQIPAALADADVIDCTSGKCVQAEPASPSSQMRPRAPAQLKGASLSPSKGQQKALSLKSGARIEPRQGGRIEIKGGRSYSCKGDECTDGSARKR